MNGHRIIHKLDTHPESLTITWADGAIDEFASLWLSDNAPGHRDPHSGQRLIDVMDLPDRPLIRAATANDGRIRIEWAHDAPPAVFDTAWLSGRALRSVRRERRLARWLHGSELSAQRDFAWISPALLGDSGARREWLIRLLQQGIAFIRGVPPTESAILETMRGIGQVAETNYGLVFDVRSVPQPENLAYSDLGLGLHTDNPYREPVPGFQALHVLIASPAGGDSLFADGFAIAEHLRDTEPQAFDVLSRTAVPFCYRSVNAELYAERPLLQLNCGGAVAAVHYNNRSIAPLDPSPTVATFYAAYRRFARLLREEKYMMRIHMEDGDLVVFDNQRTLHGRTAFTSAAFARHLRGCYLTRDSVFSEASLLERAAAHGASTAP